MEKLLKHPVPAKLLTRIGDITVSFALLETELQTLVGSLIREHQRIGQIVTAELSFRNLRALLISLYKERHGEDEDFISLQSLLRRASELEVTRNQITHSVWGAGASADTITRIKTTAKEKQGIRFHFEEVSESDLAEVVEKLQVLAQEVLAFLFKLIEKGKAINNPSEKIW